VLKTLHKRDQVLDLLFNSLLHRQYRFGQKILVKEISAETGISRQPIMTALNTMKSMGFVTIIPQVGCEVISPTARDVGDFYRMFARMEGLLAEFAAERRSEKDVAKLKLINGRISDLGPQSADADDEYRLLNLDFHDLIHEAAAAQMPHERQQGNFTMSDFFIAQSSGFTADLPARAREHEALIDAIARKKPEYARLEAERHIMNVGDEVVKALS
jgi:DNA-binding GntR family transcriptional regulator